MSSEGAESSKKSPGAQPGTALKAAYRREKEKPGLYLMPPSEVCEAQIGNGKEVSVMARRVLLGMLQYAASTGRGAEKDQVFQMRLADLRPSSYSNNTRVREALVELKEIVLLVPCLSSRGLPAISLENIFSRCVSEQECVDEEGHAIVEWTWDEGMRETLKNARFFADMERSMVNLIESQYALALYQFGSSLVSRRRFTWEGSIEELRRVLCVGFTKRKGGKKAPKFPTWKDLRKWVIEPAVLEVSQLAPFVVIMTPRMKAGAYTHVKLDFVEKDFTRFQQDRQMALNLPREERLAIRKQEVEGLMQDFEEQRRKARLDIDRGVLQPLQQILNAPKVLGTRGRRKALAKANSRDPDALEALRKVREARQPKLDAELSARMTSLFGSDY